MPKVKKIISKSKKNKSTASSVSVRKAVAARKYAYLKKSQDRSSDNASLLQKLQSELKFNMSYVNLALGLLIVLVAGILLFNYFKKNQSDLGPAQQTAAEEQQKDVEPGKLPGKYTVKEGDTLFKISQTYYQNGYDFPKIAETNKLADVNVLEIGQVLDIPKMDVAPAPVADASQDLGTGGAVNSTIWGDKITEEIYTVVEGDWLSTIAGRAYGDPMTFNKIAKANNIIDPNIIEPGTVLKIPR